jgi:hypothetical protein
MCPLPTFRGSSTLGSCRLLLGTHPPSPAVCSACRSGPRPTSAMAPQRQPTRPPCVHRLAVSMEGTLKVHRRLYWVPTRRAKAANLFDVVKAISSLCTARVGHPAASACSIDRGHLPLPPLIAPLTSSLRHRQGGGDTHAGSGHPLRARAGQRHWCERHQHDC